MLPVRFCRRNTEPGRGFSTVSLDCAPDLSPRCSRVNPRGEGGRQGRHLGLPQKGGKEHDVPCHHRHDQRPGKTGGYAAFASQFSCIPGYQRNSVERHSSFKTRVLTCSKRWAPRSVHRICCFFTMRLLTTWLMADSTKPVEMVSPCR